MLRGLPRPLLLQIRARSAKEDAGVARPVDRSMDSVPFFEDFERIREVVAGGRKGVGYLGVANVPLTTLYQFRI